MKKDDLLKAIQHAKTSTKRNFKQSLDIIISFKDLDLKQSNNQFETFVKLPHDTGKAKTMCCIIGPELGSQKENCDHVLAPEQMDKINKKEAKKLAKQYDFFVAQGNFMAQVAKAVGRYLGPRNKMPNPKAGCVVTPASNLATLKKNLQSTVRISVKGVPLVQCRIGSEETSDEHAQENALAIYNQVIHNLPKEVHNIKDVFIKVTMGPAFKVGAKEPKEVEKKQDTKGDDAEAEQKKPVEEKEGEKPKKEVEVAA